MLGSLGLESQSTYSIEFGMVRLYNMRYRLAIHTVQADTVSLPQLGSLSSSVQGMLLVQSLPNHAFMFLAGG